MKRLLSALIIVAIIASIAVIGSVARLAKQPGPLSSNVLVYIPPGSSGSVIANTLENAGVIEHALSFIILTRFLRDDGPLQAGEYLFPAQVSLKDAIAILQSGKTYARSVTIAEGLTSRDIVAILNQAEGLKGTVDVVPPEGSLLPETYYYSFGDARGNVLRRMNDAMVSAINALWAARDPDLPFSTPAQAIILASIVEKETGVPSERPRVAGVFINRLKTGMPLQSDPTVIFALTRGQKDLGRLLLRKDLEFASPYNTYQNTGLPPGPIAHPGRASIAAVLKPEKNDYYYFVADGTGGHAFAKTLAEHNKNVAAWRNRQRVNP